jgi:L-arabinonolactonase
LGASPTVVLDCRQNLGESILWDDRQGRLIWVDIHAGDIWSWSLDDAAPQRLSVGERVGAIALTNGRAVVAALESSFIAVDLETRDRRLLASITRSAPTVRLNDGRVDPAGRFVCGGMDEASPQRGLSAVYALDGLGTVATLIDGVHCANSICWSPDGTTLYFTDMPSRRIEAFDYDVATGQVANRRIFADLSGEPGLADGSIVDAEGGLWNAQWGGGKIVRYTPDGSVDREVALPVSNPTCLTFGGADLDVLFITSAWFGLSDAQRAAEPHAGSIFAFRPGVKGRLEGRYAG